MKEKEIFDKILARLQAADTPKAQPSAEDKREIGGQIKQLRAALKLTPNQCARALGVAVQTLYRWESSQPPRPTTFLKFEHLLTEMGKARPTEAGPPVAAPAAPAKSPINSVWETRAYRDLDDILEREKEAKAVYLLKSRAPFLAGQESQTQDQMVAIIQSHLDQQREFNFYFFCTDLPNDALDSYKTFRSYLDALAAPGGVANHVHGWCLTPEHAFKVGVGDSYIGWVIIEYQANRDKSRFPRDLDVLVELPVAELKDRSSNVHDTQVTRYYWFELPNQRATPTWKLWKPLIEKNMQEDEIK